MAHVFLKKPMASFFYSSEGKQALAKQVLYVIGLLRKRLYNCLCGHLFRTMISHCERILAMEYSPISEKQRKIYTSIFHVHLLVSVITIVLYVITGTFQFLGKINEIPQLFIYIRTFLSAACIVGSIVFTIVFTRASRKITNRLNGIIGEIGLIRTKAEADIADARNKTDFLANMSHEIRTPMNAICCVTELLGKEHLSNAAESYLGILRSSSENLLDIVNDILDFSKMDAGKMVLNESEYRVKGLAEDVKNIISVRLTDKPVAFTIEIDPTFPDALLGDEVRIKQILINLLGNAVKYTTKGEISLKLTYERVSKEMVDVTISVKDTGCGITPSDKEKLFDKFAQAEKTVHKHVEGTGLGLTICKQLTTMMGGSISFESELGKGSVFTAVVRQRTLEKSETICGKTDDRTVALDFLIWEENIYYRNSLTNIMDSVGVPNESFETSHEIEDRLSTKKYDYLFVSDLHFNEAVEVVNRISPSTMVVRMAEIGEHPGQGTNCLVISKPVDIFAVLEILNSKTIRDAQGSAVQGRLTTPDARVLIVDDNRVNLKVAKALLETYEAKVTAVDSGFEAIELIKMGEKFELIFMDHMMPGMDGIETARRIWELQGEERTPVIALTANTGGEIEKLFFEAGMSDFIPKPIIMKHLNYVMQKWIPIEKQCFSQQDGENIDSHKNVIVNQTPTFSPEDGLSEVWNETKIYEHVLKLFKNRSTEIVGAIDNGKDLDNILALLNNLKALAASAGAKRLSQLIDEAIPVVKIGEESVYKSKIYRVGEEVKAVNDEIDKYLAANVSEDILTFD